MKQLLHDFLRVLRAFTRVPVSQALLPPVIGGPGVPELRLGHLPGVGAFVGLAAVVAFAVVSLLLPDTSLTPLAAAIGCTLVTLVMTGALHERALAESADHLHRIAGDAAGAASSASLALVVALILKVTLLGVLAAASPASMLAALLAGHAVSRWWPLLLMPPPPARPGAATRRELATGAAWCVVPLALMAASSGVVLLVLAPLLAGAALWGVRRWVGTRTQAFPEVAFRAAQQVAELGFYFGAAVALS